MRIQEIIMQSSINFTKPQTPAQARIAALRRQKDTASRALQAERKRQRIARAQQSLARAAFDNK